MLIFWLLALVYVWSCPRFSKNQTRQKSRLTGAQLLKVIVCSLGKQALIQMGGDDNRECVLLVFLKRHVICSFSNCLDHCWCIRMLKPGKSSNTSPVVFVGFEVVGGYTEWAPKLDFVPLCIITTVRHPWCMYCSKLLRLWPKGVGHKKKF